jgi:SAM-dependent methyltransferase
MPADDEEMQRNEGVHNLFKMLRGGRNYVGPVRQALRPSRDNPNPAALDLGCGTALWMRDMSQEFPWAYFVGIDLLPLQPRSLPPNCRIEVDDFNEDLAHFYNQFDLVHTRRICAGVADYPRLINQIHSILRPSGVVLLQEYQYDLFTSNREPISIPLPENYNWRELPSTRFLPNFVWSVLWFWILRESFVARNGRVDQVQYTEQYLREHGGFEAFGTKDCWMPLGPWHQPPANPHQWGQNYLGELKRRDLLALLSSTRQVIIQHGMSLEDWDELETNVVRESTLDCERLRLMMRLRAVWAKKRNPTGDSTNQNQPSDMHLT